MTTLKKTLAALEALGSEKMRAQNTENGTSHNLFGVRLGDIRTLAIGGALGIYRDHPTSKSCTSPFAPIGINEMVRRQG